MSDNSGGTPAHGSEGHGGGAEQLVKMANDIGHYFHSEPEREAVRRLFAQQAAAVPSAAH
jgi:hypothetical protein